MGILELLKTERIWISFVGEEQKEKKLAWIKRKSLRERKRRVRGRRGVESPLVYGLAATLQWCKLLLIERNKYFSNHLAKWPPFTRANDQLQQRCSQSSYACSTSPHHLPPSLPLCLHLPQTQRCSLLRRLKPVATAKRKHMQPQLRRPCAASAVHQQHQPHPTTERP